MDELLMENQDQQEVIPLKKFKRYEQKTYKNSSHMVGAFEYLQSLSKDENSCDIRIETEDGTIIFGHKLVFMSISKYFREVCTVAHDKCVKNIFIKELNSNILLILINFIYTGEIIVTEGNAKDLLAAAIFFQLDYVKNVCAEFLQTHLDPANCLGIKSFADLHDCMELSRSSQTYIKNRFSELVDNDEFLSLSSVEVIKLISCDDIFVPLEEKVFECVMNWVKHELDRRKDFLPELMEHVRYTLISKQFLLEKVVDEPLLQTSLKCKNLIIEGLKFHVIKQLQPFTESQTIRSIPRQLIGFQKVILMLCWFQGKCNVIYWYDNLWQPAPPMAKCIDESCLTVIKDQYVLAVCGGRQFVEMLDVSSQSPCWLPMMGMLVSREDCGVCTLDNCVYAIGGQDAFHKRLNSVEAFDINTNRWKLVKSMNTMRTSPAIGVLNNFLYAVGGSDDHHSLNSVEYYNSSNDTWTLIEDMSVCRRMCGVGVIDGILYAIGGENNSGSLKSVEAYTWCPGGWTTMADMNYPRYAFGVVVLNGLLYVIGGCNSKDVVLNSIEIYNPKTNTWSLKTMSKDVGWVSSGVVVNRPPHFKIYDD